MLREKVRLTSKGQATMPKKVREFLKLSPGDPFEYVEENGKIYLRPANLSAKDLAGILHRPGQKTATIEDMNEAVEQAAAERYRRVNDRG